jgi:hypothetical protein
VAISVIAKSRGNDPIVAVRVLVNGRPAQVRRYGSAQELKSIEITETFNLPLPPGVHQVVVRADTAQSYDLSVPLDLAVTSDTVQESPTLYVLAIGADPPAGAAGTAASFAKDAAHVAAAMQTYAARQYSQVQLKSLSGSQATLAGMREGLDWLTTNVKINDVAVIYFAAAASLDDRGEVLLLTSETMRPQHALAGAELASRLQPIRGRLLLWADWRSAAAPIESTVRDSCLGDVVVLGDKTMGHRSSGVAIDDLLRDLVATDQGVAVISATSGTTAATLPGTATIGCFAQAIAEGIAGRADTDHNATVSLAELEEYVKSRVAELSANRWRPNVGRSSLIPSFPLSKP